eukprot:Hpha_TRINITY_DN8570_c0_g1::TRINITY_DN8570_c0_g1_i1::g.146308::m.146308
MTTADPELWGVAEVLKKVGSLPLHKPLVPDRWHQEGITGDILQDVTDTDLQQLGVGTIGDRRRICRYISSLFETVPPGRMMSGSRLSAFSGAVRSSPLLTLDKDPLLGERTPTGTSDDPNSGRVPTAAEAALTLKNAPAAVPAFLAAMRSPRAFGANSSGLDPPKQPPGAWTASNQPGLSDSSSNLLDRSTNSFRNAGSPRIVRKTVGLLSNKLLQKRQKAVGTVEIEVSSPFTNHMWAIYHHAQRIPQSDADVPWKDWYQTLEVVAADYDFWMELISQAEAHVQGKAEGVEEGAFHWGDFQIDISAPAPNAVVNKKKQVDAVNTALDSLYDLTPLRVEQIFSRFSKQTQGQLSLGELGLALRHQGLRKMEPLLKEVLKAVDSNQDGKLMLPEFEVALSRLKLADLCRQFPRESAMIYVMDYCAETVNFRTFLPNWHKFLFGHRQPGHIRWIHMGSPNRQLLLPLSVKYHLHPIGMEDAFQLKTQQTKVDRYGNHYFVVLSIYRLKHDGMRDFRSRVQICRQNCCFFLSGPPRWDTCISVADTEETVRAFGAAEDDIEETKTRRDEPQKSPRHGVRPVASVLKKRNQSIMHMRKSIVVQRRETGLTGRGGDIWQDLREKLQESHVRTREKQVDFLLHEILALAIDEIKPIIGAYRGRLELWHKTMQYEKSDLSPTFLQEISHISLELKDLLRVIRPMRHILRQFAEDSAISQDCRMYLEDSRVRLEHMVEDIVSLVDMCRTLQDDYRQHSDRKLNSTLFLLTVATAVFMPVQFMAGVYGMNFVDDKGKPTIPELRSEYGYPIFMVCSFMWFVFASGFAYLHMRGKGLEIVIDTAPEDTSDKASEAKNGKAGSFRDTSFAHSEPTEPDAATVDTPLSEASSFSS